MHPGKHGSKLLPDRKCACSGIRTTILQVALFGVAQFSWAYEEMSSVDSESKIFFP